MNPLLSRATPAVVKPKRLHDIVRALPPLEHGALAGGAMPKLRPSRRSAREDLQRKAEALNLVLTTEPVATHEEPAELVNRSNGSQGTSVKGMHARAASRKSQRAIGARIARRIRATFVSVPHAFAVVVLTRIAPRSLDATNLDHAFKSVIDGIAEGLGIDDASPLVRYLTTQEQGEPRQHCVRAELFISTTKEKSP